jgi:glutathione S-transferase
MSLRIWGRLSSINVQKVVWTARELNLQFERIDAGGAFGGNRTPEYLRMNPNGKIPVIDDDGFVLWESNAIVRYLAAKHRAQTLWPADLRQRADADRWMDWQATEVTPAMRNAFMQLIRTAPEQRSQALIDESNAACETLMAILDAHLGSGAQAREYLCGSRFTVADIAVGASVHRWFGLPQPNAPRPNVERWYRALMKRPAVDGVLTLPVT